MPSHVFLGATLGDGNVIESKVVNEWIALDRAEGEAKKRTATRISVLEARFSRITPDLEATLCATSDLCTLEAWVPPAVTVATLADFRRTIGG